MPFSRIFCLNWSLSERGGTLQTGTKIVCRTFLTRYEINALFRLSVGWGRFLKVTCKGARRYDWIRISKYNVIVTAGFVTSTRVTYIAMTFILLVPFRLLMVWTILVAAFYVDDGCNKRFNWFIHYQRALRTLYQARSSLQEMDQLSLSPDLE